MVSGDGQSTPTGLTVSQLARRVEMTERNIRAHQSRGLLPPPERRGRVAYYSDDHVARLERIKVLQEQGLNLAAIAALLAVEDGREPAASLELSRLTLAALLTEEPIRVDGETLRKVYRHGPDVSGRARAIAAGIMRDLGDDVYEIPSARLATATRHLVELGCSATELLDVMAELTAAATPVVERFLGGCLQRVIDHLADEGSAEQASRARGLATEVLLRTLALQISASRRQLDAAPVPG